MSLNAWEERERDDPLDDESIGNVEEERADKRHDQERRRRRTESARDRTHVRNSHRRSAESKSGESGGHHCGVVVLSGQSEDHEPGEMVKLLYLLAQI